MNWYERTWGQHRAVHTLLAGRRNEVAKIGERTELLLVNGGLRPDRHRLADLGDASPTFASRHLNPRILFDAVDEPSLPAKAWHQQICLITSFTMEGHRIVLGQFGK